MVESPYEGPTDEVRNLLKGTHRIDGIDRDVVAVEMHCTVMSRRDDAVGLAIRGELPNTSRLGVWMSFVQAST